MTEVPEELRMTLQQQPIRPSRRSSERGLCKILKYYLKKGGFSCCFIAVFVAVLIE